MKIGGVGCFGTVRLALLLVRVRELTKKCSLVSLAAVHCAIRVKLNRCCCKHNIVECNSRNILFLAQVLSDKPQLRSITDDPLVGRKSTVGGQSSGEVERLDSDDEEENFKDADKEDDGEKPAKGKLQIFEFFL